MSADGMTALIAPRVKHHAIKILPEFFNEVITGCKPFEIRKNDRDYRVRDSVTMHEWDYAVEKYTGNSVKGRIIYLYEGDGMAHGYCVFTFEPEPGEFERAKRMKDMV